MLNLPLSLQLLILSFLFSSVPRVKAVAINTTVDDNDAAISYSSGWSISNSSNSLDYGGYHHLSDQESALAEFHFTGVGVYFRSPLWPYSVGAQLTLDELAPVIVDLRDYSSPFSADGGSETVASGVVWGIQNLTAGNHTLRIEFAQGRAQYVVLDALTYTTIDSNSDPPSTSSMPTTLPATSVGSSTPNQSSTVTLAQASPPPSQSSTSNTPIVVGAVIGTVLGLVGIGLAFCYVRYRRRIIARFPRLFGIQREDEERAFASTLSSQSSRIGQTPNQLHSTSSSTLSTPLLPVRTALPPEVVQKDLPDLPPEPTPKSPRHGRRPSFFGSIRNKTAPVVPVNTEPKQSQSATSSSATSSFFPSPIHEEDIALSPKSKSGTKRPLGTEGSRKEAMARLGIQIVDNRSGAQELPSFSGFRSDYSLNQTQQYPIVAPPSVSPKAPRIQTNVATRSSIVGTPVSLPSASPHSPAPRKKVPPALDIIPESSSSRASPAGSPDRSSTRTKRRSEGRIRLEKDRKQRRRPSGTRTTSSPQGPRPRVSAPIFTPLSAALTSPNPDTPLPSDGSRPATPKTSRRRRPLPPSPLGPRRPSLSGGPHILVPLNAKSRGSIPILPTSPEVIAILQSRSLNVKADERTNADASRARNVPPMLSLLPSPSLPSPTYSAPEHKKGASSSALGIPSVSLRPRSGQPEYVKSLPAVLSAAEVSIHTPSSSISRGPLPTVPHSAPPHSTPSYPSGTSSPRSPRRLPPAPLRNIQSNKSTSVNPEKHSMKQNDTSSTEQYLFVPPYLNVDPPPYSGRRSVEPETSASNPNPKSALRYAAATSASPLPAARKVLEGSSRQPPRSVPITPTENSWTSNSTKMLANMKAAAGNGSVDSTAANMLIDLLNDTASTSSHSSISRDVRPLSVRRASSLNSTAVAVSISNVNEVPKRDKIAVRSNNSLASVSPAIAAAPPIVTVPRRPSTSSSSGPAPSDRTSTKPPPSPSSSSLSIPPQPSSPPPPVPNIPPRQRRRGKVWNSEGVNVRGRPSGGSFSSYHTGSGPSDSRNS